ncbi:MAG TPA: sigma-70 family RNA polymerase sigma factor [Anaeromyxobacteraceae bacterium]|jgi:RNA polymerase sigma-70 factor (ECF subfamily)|nr:sigma-70 family RNA polymerase sigma factor [Anaeromyxobacteraceae bacterium]
MDRTDDQLLEEARGGRREALEELLARHQRRIYRFGLKMCRDEEDAKDVLQDTLLAVARGIRDFRGQSSVSTWLYAIARSFCVKKRRRSKFAPEQEQRLGSEAEEEVVQVADPARPADETLAGRQVERALEAAIGGLQPIYREVLLLRDVEGLTAPEVAQVLGVSVEAVKSRLHRARVAVRAAVAPLLGVPEAAAAEPAAGAGACPDVVELFSRHLEGEISSDLCASMERHLSGCPRCTARCDSLRATLNLCARSPAPEVPPAVQHSVRTALQRFLSTT